jgi:hypothetical protein
MKPASKLFKICAQIIRFRAQTPILALNALRMHTGILVFLEIGK